MCVPSGKALRQGFERRHLSPGRARPKTRINGHLPTSQVYPTGGPRKDRTCRTPLTAAAVGPRYGLMTNLPRSTPFEPLETALLAELAELLPPDARPIFALQLMCAKRVHREEGVSQITLRRIQASDAFLDDDWVFANRDPEIPLAWVMFSAAPESERYLATFWASEGRLSAIEFDRDVTNQLGCAEILIHDRETLIDPMQAAPEVAAEGAETETAKPKRRRRTA